MAKGVFPKRVFNFFVKIERMRQLNEIHTSKLKSTFLHLIVIKIDVFREEAEHVDCKNLICSQRAELSVSYPHYFVILSKIIPGIWKCYLCFSIFIRKKRRNFIAQLCYHKENN